MDFKRYLSEAELSSYQPMAGDELDISINDLVNIETEVLESSEDGITIALDERALEMLEACGCGLADDEVEEPMNEAHLMRKRDLDLVKDMGDGYWVTAEDHSDDDVYKTSYVLYHLVDPKGLEDQFAPAWEHVAYLKVSPYSPRSEDIINAAKTEIAKHKGAIESVAEDVQADDGEHFEDSADFFGQFEPDWFDETKESQDGMEINGYVGGIHVMSWRYDDESMTSGYGNYDDSGLGIDESVVQHATHGAVYGENGKAKLFMTRREATEVADAMAAKHKGKTGIAVIQGPFTGYLVKMPESGVSEAGMPSSVIRHKQSMAEKTPEELYARFKNAAERFGPATPETMEKLAREMAWRHGYGKMSDHYWKKFKHLVSESVDEAEYQGHSVQLGKPTRGDVKKYKVYVRDPKSGNIKKVNFGDKHMEIKRDNPARRKNFRARHNCADKKDRTKAGYWSCRMWSTKPVSKIV